MYCSDKIVSVNKKLISKICIFCLSISLGLFVLNVNNCIYRVRVDGAIWDGVKLCGFTHSFRSFGKECDLMESLSPPAKILRLTCAKADHRHKMAVRMMELRRLNELKVKMSRSYRNQSLAEKPSTDKLHGFVTIHHPCGRLGNTMFQIASLLGIARTNNLIPVGFNVDGKNISVFEGVWFFDKAHMATVSVNNNFCVVKEDGVGTYAPKTGNLSANCKNSSASISGCLQSWKYFANSTLEVSLLLTFAAGIYRSAEVRLIQGYAQLEKHPENLGRLLTIGVHVRRTDFTQAGWNNYGLVPAPEKYLLGTLSEVEAKYPSSLIFVIGDDYGYSKTLFNRTNIHVFPPSEFPEVDMAVMHMMDRLIISAGSFGWWCGYLSRADEVYYYKDWPKIGSGLELLFNRKDYFPSHWTGRS
ncbi:hypothetical protein RvY_02874 [Ramazzottius varieornatus]|uniref:L-Fucosyltransferase n=1 Tax=Ramazzottius varieornatus TaxID=947166 RepID=A0A1D1UVR3_RAMVA|nr:hypothetical protein RvY_02874 [Ramazzottius varieornatus]